MTKLCNRLSLWIVQPLIRKKNAMARYMIIRLGSGLEGLLGACVVICFGYGMNVGDGVLGIQRAAASQGGAVSTDTLGELTLPSKGDAQRLFVTQWGGVSGDHPQTVPSSLVRAKGGSQRRKLFIQTVLPHVLRVNRHILELRAQLSALDYKNRNGIGLSPDERSFLRMVGEEYKVASLSIPLLLRRVDVVPVSLVLAQGIVESGYGTSPAARQKKSLFGQMASKTSVETFGSLSECVYCYVRNLNRNKAYAAFQNARYTMRSKGTPLCAVTLAGGLLKYSELGQAYVHKIQKMIRTHRLDAYDTTQLTNA